MDNNNKIFIIGFNKTATVSFHRFFVDNNIKSVHFHAFKICDERHRIPKILKNEIDYKFLSLAKLFLINQENNRPLLYGLDDNITVFSDITDDSTALDAKDFYKQLDKENPKSKFILNIRNIDDWIKSRVNHKSTGLLDKHCKYYNCDKEKVFEIWKNTFYNHIEDVKEYFKNRENDLLIYDIDNDTPEKIKEFLDEKYNLNLDFFKHHHKSR